MKILVTGSAGQMGQVAQSLHKNNSDYIFTDRSILDISKSEQIESCFELYKPDYCINFAAHVMIDKGEIEEKVKSHLSNYNGPLYLAEKCNAYDTKLIHISSDYVFGGYPQCVPYSEDNETSPLSEYGFDKANTEKEILNINKETYIIRTSWIYSDLGKNFVSTITKIIHTQDQVNVVFDQVGTPTNGYRLLEVIENLISKNPEFGIYNYSGEGVTSWYDFAFEIAKFYNLEHKVKPILSKDFPFIAKRPSYSVLDKAKIKQALNLNIQQWNIELRSFLEQIQV
jgi:dTDP-4-dehydrorhamnose reductase